MKWPFMVIFLYILYNLYIFARYSMVLDIRRFKDGPQKYRIQTKMYRLNIIYIFLFIIARFWI